MSKHWEIVYGNNFDRITVESPTFDSAMKKAKKYQRVLNGAGLQKLVTKIALVSETDE